MNQRLLKNGENINSQDITLFCFPFAGGGASTYTSWIKKLKDKITVCPIQLPGREERIMEKPYTDMSELLRDLTDEIVIAIKGKYVLWGHSMGGKIAYELEKYLENKGYQAQCIFASGCRIPNIPEPNPIYHLKDEAFKRELERFGGTPKKVLENKELLDFFLPMLRADFTLADTYCDNSMTVLHSPLVIPEIPLTSNRKVDTKAVKNYFMGIEETNKKGGTELPQTDLEKRIADIWCKELNISNIGRNDSFYLVGGDSLLIAQVIGKMLEKIPEAEGWEWSALLTEMMQTPTIKGIAEKIEAFQKDTDYVIDPCLVQLKKSVKENSQSVAKVLFHAGTGTLTPYNALLSYIEKDSKENEAIIGFTFGDDADYISMETSQTFRLLGEKYGKILNKLGYSNYILIGHCVGGLIALETAQYLQKKNVQVSDVTLISSNIPKQKNQTILSQATDEIYRKTLQSSLDNEILLERIFAKLIGADAYKAGYQVDEERLQQYIEYIVDQGTGDITVEALCNTGGKFEDVAKEFRLLASKSVSERLNALYNIIERPNGELMEHQLKMLNILFRVFSQNFRCVSTYEPKPYYGNMRILCCEIQGGHFYPGFFAEDYETWKPYAKGNLTFDLIKGWHLDCITEPNLGENIKKMLDFNY